MINRSDEDSEFVFFFYIQHQKRVTVQSRYLPHCGRMECTDAKYSEGKRAGNTLTRYMTKAVFKRLIFVDG